MMRRLVAIVPFLALAAPALGAQDAYVHRADSLLRAGQVFRAETLYYAAVRRQPRSPVARLALGRYLAARGATKIGATLLEEARFFGGDAAQVARELAPVYARMNDWRALAQLPASPLSAAERQRAEWLRAAPPSHLGPDSVIVAYRADGDGLGSLTIRIGGDSVEAVVDPAVRGLVLDESWGRRPGIKTWSAGRTVGVVPSARLDGLTLTNVGATFAATGGARQARIGLDVLGQFTPTFDGPGRRAILRRGGRGPTRGERVPTLAMPSGVWLVRQGGGVVPLGSEEARAITDQGPWTYAARRGEVVVGR